MNDTISRQAAIDAFERQKDKNAKGYIGGFYNKIIQNAIDALMQLPSAQPEIIYCKDCKHRGEKPIADGWYWCKLHDDFMYYCSDAERRTDD